MSNDLGQLVAQKIIANQSAEIAELQVKLEIARGTIVSILDNGITPDIYHKAINALTQLNDTNIIAKIEAKMLLEVATIFERDYWAGAKEIREMAEEKEKS